MNHRFAKCNSAVSFAFSLMLFLLVTGCASSRAATVYQFSVPVTSPWFDTGIDLEEGDEVRITASGTAQFGIYTNQVTGPDGGDASVGALFDPLAMHPETVVVSLIGKIGGSTDPYTGTLLPEGVSGRGAGYVGSSYDQVAPLRGRLFLGFNDHADAFSDNAGQFTVVVSIKKHRPIRGMHRGQPRRVLTHHIDI